MNLSIIMGRLTSDPNVKYSGSDNSMAVAKFCVAVDRRGKNAEGADFINCVAFSRKAEFAEKYLHKGTKVLVTGHILTGSYTNKDGVKVYTTEIACDDIEFAESKSANSGNNSGNNDAPKANDGFVNIPQQMDLPFMNIPEDVESELPFSPPSR